MRERDIFRMYIKRILPDTCYYFLAILLLTVFYQLSTGQTVEILYPYTIAVTIYFIWMGIRYGSYRNFFINLVKMEKNCTYQGAFGKEDEVLINQTFHKVHKEYLFNIRNLEVEQEEQRRFLSAWIHSMKTPVTVESLIVQRVNRGELNEREAMNELMAENDKLLSSLDMVLNMVRLKEFARDYRPEEFDLEEELKKIINDNKRLFIYSKVFPKIIKEGNEEEKAVVLSDRKWNRHMIEQLISNAVKYSKEEGVSKNVFFRLQKEEKRSVLWIEDQGIGIEKTDLARVFEPFFTGENGRNGKNASGIGLYFCKEISEHIQCDLQIESTVGIGTKVKIVYLNYPSEL
ncbi:sensor histidine kinase [Anaerosporobacter faecicola]|uniref:sensor histidine kinase n=1 Tax=Anaerosporobacter faecicola TaxID=2718714 RepID=UPI00143CAC72|nr:sensor histidine kinase [Anaerosporobacter faecicola]